jgi:cellulose synthase/poly-beta-1,6-N-acetylglucosamine synthase-like glycosyltransferase
LQLLLIALGVPAAYGLYLLLLTLLSYRPKPPMRVHRRMRFDVLVPAHNEAANIGRTVANLLALDWPADRYRLVVIADNCTDRTADLARLAGAEVLEREDPELRGKGYALDFGFEASRQSGWADAVAVVDADSRATPNLLHAMAARLEAGAQAVQADHGVLNPGASWRTRIMAVAFSAFHRVRSRARENLGLSCGIRGNGWCVSLATLAAVPYRAYSLVEDVEFGVELGLAGMRVCYADEASVVSEMTTKPKNAATQRRRWEQGRSQLIGSFASRLLSAAVRQRSAMRLDLAIDLVVPPLSSVVLRQGAMLLLGLAAIAAWGTSAAWYGWIAAGSIAAVVAYVLRGWQLSGVGAAGLADIVRAPYFVAWKLIVMLGRGTSGWVRTGRERE